MPCLQSSPVVKFASNCPKRTSLIPLGGFSTILAKLLRTPYYLCVVCVKVRANPARSSISSSLSVRYVVRFVHEGFKTPSIECVSHVTEPHSRGANPGGEGDENAM